MPPFYSTPAEPDALLLAAAPPFSPHASRPARVLPPPARAMRLPAGAPSPPLHAKQGAEPGAGARGGKAFRAATPSPNRAKTQAPGGFPLNPCARTGARAPIGIARQPEGGSRESEEVVMSKQVKTREERKAELDAAMERLDRGVREVFESGRW